MVGAANDVHTWHLDGPPGGRAYRDLSLFLQDQDAGIGTHRCPTPARSATWSA